MPTTKSHTPASRTLAHWGKLSPSETRIIRYLLKWQFLECARELRELRVRPHTLGRMADKGLLDRSFALGSLGAWFVLSPSAILELAHWGGDNGGEF